MVNRGSRKGSQKCNLNLIQTRFAHEQKDIIKNVSGVGIESQNETTVDGNSVGLNSGDGGFVIIVLACFPVVLQFHTIQTVSPRTFQTDQDLLTPGISHKSEQFAVLGHP